MSMHIIQHMIVTLRALIVLMVTGLWNFLNYSQQFHSYFSRISLKFPSYFIFLTYFLSLLTYFLICHIVSQVFLTCFSSISWLIFIHNFAYSSHLLPDLLRLSSLKASVMILDSYDNSNVQSSIKEMGMNHPYAVYIQSGIANACHKGSAMPDQCTCIVDHSQNS